MKKIFLIFSVISLLLWSCKKPDFLGNNPTGEALQSFSLSSPQTNDTIALNVLTPSKQVTFSWKSATPGVQKLPTYKWVAAMQSGDITKPLISITAPDNGLATSITFTYAQLDSLLGSLSVPVDSQVNIKWSAVATNGDSTVWAQNPFNLTIQRFNTTGITPFVLLGPVSSTTPINFDPTSTADSFKFNWTRATAVPSSAISYRVYFYNEGFTIPLFSMPANSTGGDSVLTISQKDFADSLTAYGITNLTINVPLKWTVAATTSNNVTQWSSYTNQLYVVHTVPPSNLFLVGGDSPIGWTPTSAIQFIQDNSTTGVYYMYAYLSPGNYGLKLLSMKADWSAPGQVVMGDAASSTSGNDPSQNTGTLTAAGGGQNIATPGAAGVYRIQVDLTNMKYNIVNKGVGIVGFVNGWDANNPIYMHAMGTNKFVILQDFTAGNEAFKFHDGVDGWNGGYGHSNYWGVPSGNTYDPSNGMNSLIIPGNDNVFQNDNPEPAAGKWRVEWDGTDPSNVKYKVTYANTMRIVGDAITPNWDPANSPQMTYMGNGVWQATNVALTTGKQFKFVSSAAWPSGGPDDKYYLDYGDDGTGKLTSVNNNNLNFTLPTGNYTVTLDEYNLTYTIN